MNLDEILAVGGKPGLYKLVAQSRNGVIVEEMGGTKRFPISQKNNVSALKDIAIYTYSEEIPLSEVYLKVAEKTNFEKAIDHKESGDKLRAYFEEILPDFDQDRVYNSDLKKLFQWFNLLVEGGVITKEAAEAMAAEKPAEGEETSED